MDWIRLCPPFAHRINGCGDTTHNIKLRDTKIAPKQVGWIFTPLYTINNLQSELRWGLVLDLFDALNLTAQSIYSSLFWLLRNKQKHLRVKNSGQYFHPSIKHHQPRIRKATKDVSRPLWCAKCGCGIRLSMVLLIAEWQAKTYQIPQPAGQNITHQQVSTTIRKPLKAVSGPFSCVESNFYPLTCRSTCYLIEGRNYVLFLLLISVGYWCGCRIQK